MSATTEELLQQILELEETIKFDTETGKNTISLRERLTSLKEQFQLMNENLSNTNRVLKG